jgi:hypothetical protein
MKFINLAITLGLFITGHYNAVCQNDTLSQSAFNKNLLSPYIRQNSLYKEKVYVHFNKSCYLPGDDIWFKAYVTDPMTGLLNIYTRTLYVELYNQKGKLVEQKILSVNSGVADNVIKLDERELPGQYTFRVYTNWMKNFYSTDEFDTPLTIVGDEKKETSVKEILYDVQFFPESGPMLEGAFNKIAVKALDPNGISAQLSGIVIDNNNDSIASFKLNHLGMGEFVLNPSAGMAYKAKVSLPGGKEQIVTLPVAESKGIIASVNGFLKNRIFAEVKSNAGTIGSEKLLYILIHNNGNVYKTLTAKLTPDQPLISFSFDRSEAGNGVNCLTVFDEKFQPIAERLFYNRKTNIRGNVDIRQTIVNDSVQFDLKVAGDSAKRLFSSLSLSVLPEGTVSNKFTNSLLSDVLLQSGVKGNIENPNYYFEKDDLEHSRAMDLLLLTQGWRKYDWKEIASNQKKLPFEFEKGFIISGTVKSWMSGKEDKSGRVSLLSPENKLFRIINVDSTGHFLIPGLYLTDSTRVMVSASSSKGKNWNRTILASVEPYHLTDSTIAVKPFINYVIEMAEKPEPPLKLLPGVIQLPEVTVTAKKILPFEGSVYVSLFDKSVEITKENYARYTSLEKLLLVEFNVRLSVDPEGNYSLDMGRAQKTAKPRLIVDDIEAPDLNYLAYYTIEQIEAVSVNRDGNAIVGDGGALIIKTRKNPINWGSAPSPNMKNLLIRGYAPTVNYYSPKYLQKPESVDYQKYASIYWKADIVTDSTGITSFRFTVPKELNVVNVRTEGISDDGTIYLDERKVAIER